MPLKVTKEAVQAGVNGALAMMLTTTDPTADVDLSTLRGQVRAILAAAIPYLQDDAEPAPVPAKSAAGARRLLAQIRADIERDMADFEGAPFTGPVVARVIGHLAAQVDGLANVCDLLLDHIAPAGPPGDLP